MFDFRRITLFCLEKRLSTHKMTIFSNNLGGTMAPLRPWLRLCAGGVCTRPNLRFNRDRSHADPEELPPLNFVASRKKNFNIY